MLGFETVRERWGRGGGRARGMGIREWDVGFRRDE